MPRSRMMGNGMLPNIGGGGGYLSNVLSIADCIAYWPLTQTSGSSVTDLTGHGVTGTATNITWADTAGAGGSMGSAPLFGATSYISLLVSAINTAGLTGGEMTMACWIKNPGWAASQTITAFQLDVNGTNRCFIRQAGTNILNILYQAGGTYSNFSTSSGLSANWMHIATTITKTGDAKKNYVNGSQSGATQTGLGTFAATFTVANIGRRVDPLFGDQTVVRSYIGIKQGTSERYELRRTK